MKDDTMMSNQEGKQPNKIEELLGQHSNRLEV